MNVMVGSMVMFFNCSIRTRTFKSIIKKKKRKKGKSGQRI